MVSLANGLGRPLSRKEAQAMWIVHSLLKEAHGNLKRQQFEAEQELDALLKEAETLGMKIFAAEWQEATEAAH
jgi:hypothetical protein